MAQVTIFKIHQNKKKEFLENLKNLKGSLGNKVELEECTLFFYKELQTRPLKLQWSWAIPNSSFEEDISVESVNTFFKGILCIEKNDNLYAVTFGNSFYMVDKFCDKNFAFDFARKFDYETIKSTSQVTPSSNKNKVINSYIKSDFFEYDSGEAFIKIKACVKLEKDFSLFKKNIEIGTSIKLNIDNPDLTKLVDILNYIENKLKEKDLTKIPLFSQVKEVTLLKKLDNQLAENIKDQNIIFSDFDIIGTNEIFYSLTTQYRISYKRKKKDLDTISMAQIEEFCTENNLNLNEIYNDLTIMLIDQSSNGEKYKLRQLIDMVIEQEKCVLVNGEWFQYNEDYLESLKESLNELDCIYDSNFDWNQKEYDDFIEENLPIERKEPNNQQKTDEELRESLRKKYYPERFLNQIMEKNYGYKCNDRKLTSFGNGDIIELNDLCKEDSIYAVKIGSTSSKLSYAVSQMSTAMKVIKKQLNMDDYYKNIRNVVLVLILQRKSQLAISENNKININELNMLALKNSLDVWQKEAIKLKFHPKVIIAYK